MRKLPLRAYVLYGFLLSLLMSSVTLSSYVTTQSKDPQVSQVAGMAFLVQGQQNYNMTTAPIKLDVSDGSRRTSSFSFTIQNYNTSVSEVGLNYAVKMSFDAEPDAGVAIQVVANNHAGSLTKVSPTEWLYQDASWTTSPSQAQSLEMSVNITAVKTNSVNQNFNFAILNIGVIATQID